MAEKSYGLAVVVRLVDRISGSASRVSRAFNDLLGKAKALDTAGRLQQFGNRMLLQATLLNQAAGSMKGGFDKAIASFTGIEDAATAFKTVATPVAGSVANAYQLGIDRAIAFSRENVQSAATYLRSSYQMASAGLQTEAALYGTETAMKVATATMGNEVEAALLLATTYKNLGNVNADVQGEMIRLGDVLTVTQQKFLFPSLQPLIEGMKYAGVSAKTMRVPLEQLMPIMGLLNTAGMQGSMAGTAFRQALAQLIPASRKLGIALRYTKEGNLDLIGFIEDLRQRYGLLSSASAETQEKLMSAFGGVRGFEMIKVLSGQEETLRRYQIEMQNSAGVTEATAATMQSTFSASLKILRNNVTALFYEIGKAIAPTIAAIAGVLRVVVAHVQDFAARYPLVAKIAGAFLGLMAAISAIAVPIIFLVGSLSLLAGAALPVLVAIGGFILSAAPFIAAAIAMGIVAYEIYKNWDLIVGKLKGIWEGLVHGVSSLATRFWQAGKNLVLSLSEGIRSVALWPINAVKNIAEGIAGFVHHSEPKYGPLRGLTTSGLTAMESYGMGFLKGWKDLAPAAQTEIERFLSELPPLAPEVAKAAVWRRFGAEYGYVIRNATAEGMKAVFPFPRPELTGRLGYQRWRPPYVEPLDVWPPGSDILVKKYKEAFTVPLPEGAGGDGAALGGLGAGVGMGGGPTIRNYYINQHFERDSIKIQAGSVDGESFLDLMREYFPKLVPVTRK